MASPTEPPAAARFARVPRTRAPDAFRLKAASTRDNAVQRPRERPSAPGPRGDARRPERPRTTSRRRGDVECHLSMFCCATRPRTPLMTGPRLRQPPDRRRIGADATVATHASMPDPHFTPSRLAARVLPSRTGRPRTGAVTPTRSPAVLGGLGPPRCLRTPRLPRGQSKKNS